MKRREFISLIGVTVGFPFAGLAQQDQRLPYVCVLTGNLKKDLGAQARIEAFRQGLAGLGWTEEKFRLEVRWPGPDVARQRSEARELVALAPDVIVATSTPTARALRDVTQTIPVVFIGLSDPVATGIVSNLARPDANLTGFTLYEHSLSGKWLSLLKDMAPQLRHVALLFNPDTSPYAPFYLKSAQEMAERLALEVTTSPVRQADEIAPAIAAIAASGNGGLIVLPDGGFIASQSAAIIELASRHRVPAIYAIRHYAASGGLISYGADLTRQFYDGVGYVDRILRGVTPGELPVQFATKFELVINQKAAEALGLTIPPRLMIDAEVID